MSLSLGVMVNSSSVISGIIHSDSGIFRTMMFARASIINDGNFGRQRQINVASHCK